MLPFKQRIPLALRSEFVRGSVYIALRGFLLSLRGQDPREYFSG